MNFFKIVPINLKELFIKFFDVLYMIIITVKCMVSDFESYIRDLLHIIMYNPWTVKMFNSANFSFIEQITSLG